MTQTAAPAASSRNVALTDEDRVILDTVEHYLADGLALHRWWQDAGTLGRHEQRFELQRSFNRASSSYGFFDHAVVQDREEPIMGNVQDMMFDRTKAPAQVAREDVEWSRCQLREFVLRYFMRVSSFRQPEAAVSDTENAPSSWLGRISWCSSPEVVREGFGFAQLYYKTPAGEVGKFADTSKIVDLREIGDKYEWIVLKVDIFHFSIPTHPLGASAPELIFKLDEASYIVVHRDFVLDRERPRPGVLGEYGIGYAFIRNPKQGFLAFGPGQFSMAMQLIQFRITESGEIDVHMVFAVNRPDKVANLPIEPVNWCLRLAEVLSLGMASPLLNPLRSAASHLPLRLGSFDPVNSYIQAMSLLTNSQSEEKLCISREQLDKRFLLQHFMQHYETLAGALFTWRQIPDWLNSPALPRWVVTGRSS